MYLVTKLHGNYPHSPKLLMQSSLNKKLTVLNVIFVFMLYYNASKPPLTAVKQHCIIWKCCSLTEWLMQLQGWPEETNYSSITSTDQMHMLSHISGLGPSQIALFLQISLSKELDNDDWVTWRGVRLVCMPLHVSMNNSPHLNTAYISTWFCHWDSKKLCSMAFRLNQDDRSFCFVTSDSHWQFLYLDLWRMEEKKPHSQVWFGYTGSNFDCSMRLKEACLRSDKHTQRYFALSYPIAVNLCAAVRYSIDPYLPFLVCRVS